jgi:hypothetical protein
MFSRKFEVYSGNIKKTHQLNFEMTVSGDAVTEGLIIQNSTVYCG